MMRLIVETGPDRGTVVDLTGEVVIGRGPDCQLRLSDQSASTRHCSVRVDGDRVEIRDLGSTNGTRVDGTKVEGSRTIADGAAISIGDSTIRLQGDRGAMVASSRRRRSGAPSWPAPSPTLALPARLPPRPTTTRRSCSSSAPTPDRGKHVALPATGSVGCDRACRGCRPRAGGRAVVGHHTRVSSGPDGLRMQDLGSTNGTKLERRADGRDEAELGRRATRSASARPSSPSRRPKASRRDRRRRPCSRSRTGPAGALAGRARSPRLPRAAARGRR